MSNVITLAGRELDFDSLDNHDKQELVSFFDYLTFKRKKPSSDIKLNTTAQAEEKVLTLDELFKTVKGKLPPDYKFDREEANAR